MRHFETETVIDAGREEVWRVLADTSSWSDWDSGVLGVEGEAARGSRIKIRSELNPKRAYPVKVIELEPNRRMAWLGGVPLGLFKGVRTYTLTPEGEGRTRFTMREEFSGPLLPLIWRTMPDMNGLVPAVRGRPQAARRGRPVRSAVETAIHPSPAVYGARRSTVHPSATRS